MRTVSVSVSACLPACPPACLSVCLPPPPALSTVTPVTPAPHRGWRSLLDGFTQDLTRAIFVILHPALTCSGGPAAADSSGRTAAGSCSVVSGAFAGRSWPAVSVDGAVLVASGCGCARDGCVCVCGCAPAAGDSCDTAVVASATSVGPGCGSRATGGGVGEAIGAIGGNSLEGCLAVTLMAYTAHSPRSLLHHCHVFVPTTLLE